MRLATCTTMAMITTIPTTAPAGARCCGQGWRRERRRPCLGWAAAPQVTRDMGRAAGAWLARLDARQRREAQLEWTSRSRESWHYVPRSRPGLALRAMDAGQMTA